MANTINERMFGYIDHKYNGHKVRLHGQIIGLNEGDLTAKMIFDNGVVSDGIPMESIVLDEWSLNGIKKAANRAWNYIKGKFSAIGGAIRKIVNGIPVPFNRASNIGANVAKGLVPKGVGVYLAKSAKAEGDECGIPVQDQEAPDRNGVDSNGVDEDLEQRNFLRKVFSKVIKFADDKTSTEHLSDNTEKELKESFKNVTGSTKFSPEDFKKVYIETVKEEYGSEVSESLSHNIFLNQFFGIATPINEAVDFIDKKAVNKILNETTYTSPNEEPGLSAYETENIPIVGMKEIVDEIMGQLKVAFGTGEFDFKTPAGKILKKNMMTYWARAKKQELIGQGNTPEIAKDKATRFAIKMFKQFNKSSRGAKPVMIWGAPGIGKTSIVQQCRGMFKEATKGSGTNGSTNGFDINMLECVLSKMTADDFTLPTKGEDPLTGKARVVNGIQSWIPCWQVTGDKELDKVMDRAANLKMNTKDALQNAGIDIPREINDKDYRESIARGTRLTRTNDDSYTGVGFEDKTELPESWKYRINENYEDDEYDFDAAEEEMSSEEEMTITDGGVIFFDELTRAPKGVMNVIMNLINDRKVGEGWVLGSHWIIVCAANRFYEMTGIDNTWEKAFGTRFLQYTFVPEFEDWKKWAMGYDFNPKTGRYSTERGTPRIDQQIIDFLSAMQHEGVNAWYEKVGTEGKDKKAEAKIYANPRSWQTASDLMVRKAQEENPGNPYIVDTAGNYSVNLNLQQKLDCISAAVGTGSSTYKAFYNYQNTRFFTPDMRASIINYGNITGGDLKAVSDIERGKYIKVPGRDDSLKANSAAKKLIDAFIPNRKDIQGNERGKVSLGPAAVKKLVSELFNQLNWETLTNTQVANVLTYCAVVSKYYVPGNSQGVFNEMWVAVFRKFMRAYMDNNKKALMPKDLQQALGEALMNNGNGDKSNYVKWMAPAHKVYIFANGWNGMDGNAPQASNAENAMLDSLEGAKATDRDFTTGMEINKASEV